MTIVCEIYRRFTFDSTIILYVHFYTALNLPDKNIVFHHGARLDGKHSFYNNMCRHS